jgi:hypothetical protein
MASTQMANHLHLGQTGEGRKVPMERIAMPKTMLSNCGTANAFYGKYAA